MEAEPLFRLIAITPPAPVTDEAAKIAALLDAGWWRVHLRHPGADDATLEEIISRIPAVIRGRVSMHDSFGLAVKYGIGGVHLNRRTPAAPEGWPGTVSRSCHSVGEALMCAGLDYITLSPVFDSISKPGYTGVEFGALPSGVTVIGLGGVTPERAAQLKARGFAGAAMLGAIPWQATVREITGFATKTLEIC